MDNFSVGELGENNVLDGDEDAVIWELEGDLATVACYAAADLDYLLVTREGQVGAVERLIKMLRSSIPPASECSDPSSLVDPLTVMTINHALSASRESGNKSITTLKHLVDEASGILDTLDEVSRDPQSFVDKKREEMERMRGFCVALSRSALSCEPHPYEPMKTGP